MPVHWEFGLQSDLHSMRAISIIIVMVISASEAFAKLLSVVSLCRNVQQLCASIDHLHCIPLCPSIFLNKIINLASHQAPLLIRSWIPPHFPFPPFPFAPVLLSSVSLLVSSTRIYLVEKSCVGPVTEDGFDSVAGLSAVRPVLRHCLVITQPIRHIRSMAICSSSLLH